MKESLAASAPALAARRGAANSLAYFRTALPVMEEAPRRSSIRKAFNVITMRQSADLVAHIDAALDRLALLACRH
jgi:hypothetical protein